MAIVFIHRGRDLFVDWTLAQARLFNPTTPIYFLGDCKPLMPTNSHFLPIRSFERNAKKFAPHYRHLSSNGYEFELICFQRWMILLEWMEEYDLEKCFYVDTDVLLYEDIEEQSPCFSEFDLTQSSVRGPINGYINNRDCLRDFQNFIFQTYTQRPEKLEDWHRRCQQKGEPGDISDMTLLGWFKTNSSCKIGDVCQIRDGAVHDQNINRSDGFVLNEKSRKQLTWQQNIPWGIFAADSAAIRFRSLHFQGRSKKLMGQFSVLPAPLKLRIRLRHALLFVPRNARRVRKIPQLVRRIVKL